MSDQSPPATPTPAVPARMRHRSHPYCAICGKESREPIAFGMVRPSGGADTLAPVT